ncbi:phosphoribosylformylglycinamidine synthase [Marivirga sp. S37H4]|uniref:Phosphoribosylformylglycinamidine synthase n=1 Tax=Marivirga aurantiaca TaxID=2802615 RepID=A0A935C9C8_9BACT|nr:HAEPLYID family protein [Marivirga aurantiaca]MBK6265975.1 phosphoribosylformylglycinamidine synthase [Marivirga aurantiaca]
MHLKNIFVTVIVFLVSFSAYAQEETGNNDEPLKIDHAEPLFIDLIRDLGARKGEKEWNLGLGMFDRLNYDKYEALVEYEWAPKDRLGLEIEVPVSIYTSNGLEGNIRRRPSNRVESIKTAFQWTFLVSEKMNTSMAIGGINEFVFTALDSISTNSIFEGDVINPFLISATNWRNGWHTLIYTGPKWFVPFNNELESEFEYEINSNVHYMIPNTRNFIGVEFNKVVDGQNFEMVIRPQMRLSLSDKLLMGIVGGIPVNRDRERLSTFIRLIYEPGHKHE